MASTVAVVSPDDVHAWGQQFGTESVNDSLFGGLLIAVTRARKVAIFGGIRAP